MMTCATTFRPLLVVASLCFFSSCSESTEVREHPRLFASREDLSRLERTPTLPAMVQAHAALLQNAEAWVKNREFSSWGSRQDPSGLLKAREWVDRYITLAAAFLKTGDDRYRVACLEYVHALDELKTGPFKEQNEYRGFWLSDGEEAAGIAIVYDWLYHALSEEERRGLVEIARQRLFPAGQEAVHNEKAWWFGKRFSNWNAVCVGGLGMLCLAMYDEAEAARELLPGIEKSLATFMEPLEETGGGWPEGLGYWNYGMAYAFQYLMSWERAFDKVHPLMELPATRQTLAFPFDFYPNNRSAGFGDNNHFHPTSFHYAAAERLDLRWVMGAIDRYLIETGQGLGGLMGAGALFCVQHPDRVVEDIREESQVARVYEGLGWGLIADRMPGPSLYLSMRGGTTTEEHNHVDLLSFRVLVGSEWMIETGSTGGYLHPTYFDEHRSKVNDLNATYKNTLFINGVGPVPGSRTESEEVVRGDGVYGLRKDASKAMVTDPGFCGRLALMVDDRALVIIDRVETDGLSRVEARMHSFQDVEFGETGAMIRGQEESLRVTYASLEEAGLFEATTAPVNPQNPSGTMLRWCPLKLYREAVLVTLLTPGEGQAEAEVERDGDGFVVRLLIDDRETILRVSSSLRLVDDDSSRTEE
jgi:hypothetical protein